MAGLTLALLGPPRVERDGAPLEVDTRKAIALLAYLAVTRQDHRCDQAGPSPGRAGQQPPLPGGVRELLRSRLSNLGETGRQLLATAAVLGRSFDFETARAASGRGDEEAVAALEELVARGLVREVGEASRSQASYDVAAALGGPGDLARVEHKLGNVYGRRGDWELAESHFEGALAALGAEAGALQPEIWKLTEW